MIRPRKWAGFRSVLCAVDFSETSRLALRYAAAVAARGNGILGIAYVNDPLLIAAAAAAMHDRHLARRSARELQEFVETTLSARARQALHLKSHVSIGSPADEIMKAGIRTRADLIVLGTHGVTGADRLLMGSTTLSVLQQTTVPVLAVPRAGEHLVTSPSLSWPGRLIVAAVELDSRAGRDVDVAARIAAWFGSSLGLVHVVDEIDAPAWLNADLGAHDRIRVARAEQQIGVLVKRSEKHVATAGRVLHGRVADELAAVAATERTGLLITALRHRRGWFGANRGSISYHVLTHATVPVLACPPNWRPR